MSFIGPVIVFLVGLVAWFIIGPQIPEDTVALLVTWAGIIAVIASLIWAAVIAYRLYGGRTRRGV